jgi:hypothetical protein
MFSRVLILTLIAVNYVCAAPVLVYEFSVCSLGLLDTCLQSVATTDPNGAQCATQKDLKCCESYSDDVTEVSDGLAFHAASSYSINHFGRTTAKPFSTKSSPLNPASTSPFKTRICPLARRLGSAVLQLSVSTSVLSGQCAVVRTLR